MASSQVRVVLVDDSPIVRGFVSKGLAAAGFEVISFADPFEVLERIRELDAAIVVTDLEMPGMDGVTLCHRLRERGLRMPTILLTASDDDARRVSGLRSGADDFVNKNASIDELAARISTIVKRTSETERVRRLFVRYTSDAVVEQTLAAGDVVLAGENREVTVLFADLRDFTALAEAMAPEQVVGILNAVLGRLSDVVLAADGTLDKFLGDGLMATFGAPLSRPDDAVRAVRVAQLMLAAIDVVREHYPGVNLALGIGVNSGVVIAGNIGSAQRTEYTVIGDAVNVAARLCALAAPGEILVGKRTQELVCHALELETLEPVLVKGKARPIPIFRVG